MVDVAFMRKMLQYVAYEIQLINRETAKRTLTTVEEKRDFKSEIDFKSQEYIVNQLKQSYPNITIVGEENSESMSQRIIKNNEVAVFDPLDGTDAFSFGLQLNLPLSESHEEDGIVTKVSEKDFKKYGPFITVLKNNQAYLAGAIIPQLNLEAFSDGKETTILENKKELHYTNCKKKELSDAIIAWGTMSNKFSEKFKIENQQLLKVISSIPGNRRFGGGSAIYENIATCLPNEHPEAIDLYVNAQVYAWDTAQLLLQTAGRKTIMIQQTPKGFEIKEFSYKYFKFTNPESEMFAKPYSVITGNPFLVDKVAKHLEKQLK